MRVELAAVRLDKARVRVVVAAARGLEQALRLHRASLDGSDEFPGVGR